MAFKRLFDRVVLKLSKLAYAGIYGEDEADEFRDPLVETEKKPKKSEPKAKKEDPAPPAEKPVEKPAEKTVEKPMYKCEKCGKTLEPYNGANGQPVPLRAHAERSEKLFGKILCLDCINESKAN